MKLPTTRFDFGVPLEDVFPPNDIHPRLKYLFKAAYQHYMQSGLSMHQVLRECQGSLELRLELKHRLVYELYYEHLPNYLPGTYFWLIRHFIGLLPIPLMPKFANSNTFDWTRVAEKCKRFLKKYQSRRERKFELDYILAQNLNMLPFEHFLLLHVLITFIRKLSQTSINNTRLNRKHLVALVNFYCGAVFTRPYRPGYERQDTKITPLFIYILLRWREIQKISNKIGHPVYFLDNDPLHTNIYREIPTRNKWVQTSMFNPDVIAVCKNIPYICCDNAYLKDIGSQTETPTLADAEIQSLISPAATIDTDEKLLADFEQHPSSPALNNTFENLNSNSINSVDCTFLTAQNKSKINEDNLGSDEPQKGKAKFPWDDDDEAVAEDNIVENIERPRENTDNTDLSFFSTPNKVEEWSDIVKELSHTVKKVEEYIYDDYETFKKEAFNQLSNTVSKPLFLKKSKSNGVSQTTAREPQPEKPSSALHSSYFKFHNGIDHDFGNFYSPESANVPETSINVTFRSCYSSEEKLCSSRTVGSPKDEKKSKTNFNLKRFKIKMDFLRMLTPGKGDPVKPCNDYNISNVNYKKIENVKAYTL